MVRDAAVDKGIWVSAREPAFSSSGYTPTSGIARSQGGSIFNFWRNGHAVSTWLCSLQSMNSRAPLQPSGPRPYPKVGSGRALCPGLCDHPGGWYSHPCLTSARRLRPRRSMHLVRLQSESGSCAGLEYTSPTPSPSSTPAAPGGLPRL